MYMKKLIFIFISIMIVSFLLINYMVTSNHSYIDSLEKKIIDNTEISSINYINEYGDYYIALDDKYLYLINKEYNIIFDVDLSLIHKNTKNYDIIYTNDTLMYFSDKYKNGKLVYEYYDLYTYELIDKILVGDNNG